MVEKQEQGAYKKYTDFWAANVQNIEQIQIDLDTELRELENLYPSFEQHYHRLKELIDVLTSIYSCINTLDGRDYALKLKALIDSYLKRYTREGIDFGALNYLSNKISILLDSSFEDFPLLEHHAKGIDVTSEKLHYDVSNYRYRWITFMRGRSWFIAPFQSLNIYDAKNCDIISTIGNDTITVRINDKGVPFTNMFALWDKGPVPIRYFVSINAADNYAATLIGKTIYSKTDIISPKIKSYPGRKQHTLSPGRVRFFGRNHILLA